MTLASYHISQPGRLTLFPNLNSTIQRADIPDNRLRQAAYYRVVTPASQNAHDNTHRSRCCHRMNRFLLPESPPQSTLLCQKGKRKTNEHAHEGRLLVGAYSASEILDCNWSILLSITAQPATAVVRTSAARLMQWRRRRRCQRMHLLNQTYLVSQSLFFFFFKVRI